MVYRRRRNLRKKGPARRRPGMRLRRRYVQRNTVRIFTETLEVSNLLCNQDLGSSGTGQVWSISMSSVPQLKQYQGLYSQYKILKMKYKFIPEYNSFESNQADANAGAAGNWSALPTVAVCTARDPKTASSAPPNEIAVLSQNNSFIKSFTKPFTVTVYKPLPDLTVGTAVSGTSVPISLDKTSWISLVDTTGPPPTGTTAVQHFGLQTYTVCADNSSFGNRMGRVYCDVTFALREPL